MEFRPARAADLPALVAMYRGIVGQMQRQGLSIWDEVYPCEFLQQDLELDRLHLLAEGGELLGAFALCDGCAGSGAVQWPNPHASALYLDRLGVNAAHQGRGLGGALLRRAAGLAAARGAGCLRLFAVESNLPALRLYRRHGFRQAEGVYLERIDAALTLREYGFELVVLPERGRQPSN